MLKRLLFQSLFLIFLSSIFLMSAPRAQAGFSPQPWRGVCVASQIEGGSDVATLQGFECLIGNVFAIIITVIGMAGFVMFVIGSFRWMLSGNDSKGVETAKNTMTFAIIGIVVAISGFIILNLLSAFTGLNLTQFIIPGDERDYPFSTPVPGNNPPPGQTGPF